MRQLEACSPREPDLPPGLPEGRAHPTIASLAGSGFISATEWRTVRENMSRVRQLYGHGSATH